MRLIDTMMLVLLASIWGISFVFTRTTVGEFGPVGLIVVRVGVAALCLLFFLLAKKRRAEFLANWKSLAWIGVLSSAVPFIFLSYASLSLTAGTVSIINAMTPIFTAWIAHIWLKDTMGRLQFLGLVISIFGLILLFWGKVSFNANSWLPVLVGLLAACCYGISTNGMRKYLTNVSTMTKTAGGFFFAALFMLVLAPFFIPDIQSISPQYWLYAILLGVLCTAIAYVIFFRLLANIGAAKTVSVTFLVPIFSFLWGYLLLGEVVTLRMWGATLVILLGMSLVLQILGKTGEGVLRKP